MKNDNEFKEKKILFSEEIDSFITGISLGIALLLVAAIVIWFDVFENDFVNRAISIFMIAFGLFGTLTELNKFRSSEIEGISDFFVGMLISLLSAVLFQLRFTIVTVIAVAVLLIGLFGLIKGIIEIGYSFKRRLDVSTRKKLDIMKLVVAGTEVIALIVAILQLVKECMV